MQQFPKGCSGCNGACCYTPGGVPPFEPKVKGEEKQCIALRDDGRCSIQVVSGYDAKPQTCKDWKLGGDPCIDERQLHGHTV